MPVRQFKVCTRCKQEKPIEEFSFAANSRKYRRPRCKPCRVEVNREYAQKNKECIAKYSKEWRNIHAEKLKEKRQKYYAENKETILAQQKKYYQANKEKISETNKAYRKRQLESNVQYKLAHALRKRLHLAVKHEFKSGSAVTDLGCSIQELKIHLEKQFQPGMTWDNWSQTGWHIDHIEPLSSFDLTNREELLKACHYSNLQPLWAKDNLRKNKYETGNNSFIGT